MAAMIRKGLLHSYSARLVTLAEHTRADAAMVEAHRERALAEVSRIDMLKAQARDPAKSEFFAHMLVAHMSHELRTPLNAIIGFSDMIRLCLKKMPADGKVLGYADDINSAGWHLLRVINDILDLSKIEAGKLDLNEEIFDFATAAESCARMIKGQMDEKRLTFVCQIPTGLPRLLADDLKIKQVLINLLSNAVKFTPPDGQVTMRAELEANGSFAIEIADTGIGIAAEDIPKVFTPFSQLNANVSRQVQGTGLGLPLARALVQLHGGTLTLASEVGKGTVVIARLPASRVVRNASATKGGHSPSGAQPEPTTDTLRATG
jgi:signal transduction histidine kinase